jgi:hypothetical protein
MNLTQSEAECSGEELLNSVDEPLLLAMEDGSHYMVHQRKRQLNVGL